jgi:hypothetical protein
MEAAMIAWKGANGRPAVLGAVGRWWTRWRAHWGALTELVNCSPAELERIARDAGTSVGELHVLAGKWPEAADPMMRRAAALGLEADEIGRKEPLVRRDLQRVCSPCGSKRECEHDLARDPSNPHWRDYCPNAVTFDALESEQSQNTCQEG